MKSAHDFRSCNEQLKRLKKNLKKSRALHLVIAKFRMRFPVKTGFFIRLGLFYFENSVHFHIKCFGNLIFMLYKVRS